MIKTRFREKKRFLRKSLLVLQIGEEKKVGPYYCNDGDPMNTPPPSWDENKSYTSWRDATIEDLSLIEIQDEEYLYKYFKG